MLGNFISLMSQQPLHNVYSFGHPSGHKVLDYWKINSKWVWNCHQPLVKLAKLNIVQPIWVPGNMEIDGNEVPEQLAQARFLTSTFRTWACPWYTYRGCLGSDEGLNEQETRWVLAAYPWAKASKGLSYKTLCWKSWGITGFWAETSYEYWQGC